MRGSLSLNTPPSYIPGMAKSRPLAAIVRVSHVGTRDGDSFHADEEQVTDVNRYVAQHGLSVEFMPPELSVSGGKPIQERPSLRAAIEGVERGEYSGIVVAYLSRLTRSRSGIEIWERVEAAGGHVHCAAENLDTSTPNGRFIRDIHLANAVREREEHAERHARRRRETVNAGRWRVRQVPRGYRFKGPANERGEFKGPARHLVPDPKGAREVRQAADDAIAGVPMTTIARRLKMTPSGVRAMLRNRVYLGELRDGDNINPSAHPPILDADTHDAVVHALQSRPRPARSSDGTALLAGLVRCAGCGHVMSRKQTKQRVYACAVHHSGGSCPAPANIGTHILDPLVERIARAELERIKVEAANDTEGRVQAARDVVVETERELAAYVSAISAADVGAAVFAEGARGRRARLDAAQATLREELSREAAVPIAASGAAVWDDLDATERNTLLRALLSTVVVRRAGGRGARLGLHDRVRVLRWGAPFEPLRPFWPDVNDPDVLGLAASEDAA